MNIIDNSLYIWKRSRKMTIRHFKIFIAVADAGSMTAAAEILFISQPTVSQAVAELEAHYGTRLFDRLSKRLYITETGRKLLSYARHMISLLDDMEQTVKNSEETGTLRIGASITVGTALLPGLVNEFTRLLPSMQIKAAIDNTKEIEAMILKNEVDFALVEGIIHSRDIVAKAFMDDELVLVCGSQHPLYKAGVVSVSDLGEYGFIVREQGSGTRELFERAAAANLLNWRCIWECSDSGCLKSATLNGIGLAVISKKLVEPEIRNRALAVVKVENFDLKRKFSIIHHKNKYLASSMKAFFDLCYSYSSKGI